MIKLMDRADGRKVSTDALETLGTIIDDKQKRDAIHLAVLPAVAGERLFAGQDIGIVDGRAIVRSMHLGIVDPFVKGPIQEGQRFWMVLYPRMVTSLRHVWTHPAFSDDGNAAEASDKAAAEAWLDDFATQAGLSRGQLIAGANDYLDSQRTELLCEDGRWEGFSTPDEFWPHFETVTGRKVPSGDRGNFFSCSC